MRLVVKVEDDGGMVLVGRRAILPEHHAVLVGHRVLRDVGAPLAAIRPVQVQHDVTSLRGTGVHDCFDERPIGNALVLLFRGLSEPAILRQGQADDIRVPFLNGGVHRLKDVPLAIARPFQAGRVDPS